MAFIGGVLTANAVPHLVTAARRGRMLTPLRGTDSGPGANLAWGMANLVSGAAVTAAAARRGGGRGLLVPFAVGGAVFAGWAVAYEAVTRWRRSVRDLQDGDAG